MKNTDCFFCSILKEEHCKFYENEFFYSHLSHAPVNPGHIELIPKRHVTKITDLNDVEWKTLKDTIHETITLLQDFDFLTTIKTFQKVLRSDI
jgi:diadenosine tetraphosphate (Ap4A) HIT family hydrolase